MFLNPLNHSNNIFHHLVISVERSTHFHGSRKRKEKEKEREREREKERERERERERESGREREEKEKEKKKKINRVVNYKRNKKMIEIVLCGMEVGVGVWWCWC